MINWKNVDKLSSGHGVLFIYKPINKPVAFLKGYKWLNDTPDSVDVELLNNNSILFKENKLDEKSIIKKAKGTATYFLYPTLHRFRFFYFIKGDQKKDIINYINCL